MSSKLHSQDLIKYSDDTYVLVGTSSDNVAAMISQVIWGHRISYCDEELPFKGNIHNKGLYVIITCWDRHINCILEDDWSSLNIFPISTLRLLKFDMEKIQQNQVNVRYFDEVQRYSLVEVNLIIQMGPAKLNVEFQVLDINTSYNLLLGRSFIHMVGIAPSTLHRLMNFFLERARIIHS